MGRLRRRRMPALPGDRFKTRLSRLDSKHSFRSPGTTDPLNNHPGLLLVNNDDVVRPKPASRQARNLLMGLGERAARFPPRRSLDRSQYRPRI
jgi:hypothetical protein